MKRTLATLILSTLALTACGTDSDTNTGTITPEVTTEVITETTEAAPETATTGDTVNIATQPGNEVTMTITDTQLGGECRYGTNDYGGEYDPEFGKLPEGKQLLQLWADVDVFTLADREWIMLNDPDVIDADGYTQMVEMDIDCRDADDGHQAWSSTIDQGDKKRLYGSFVVPEGIQQVRIHGITFDVTN